MPLFEGHHYFIATLLFRILPWPIRAIDVYAFVVAIAAAGPASLFTIIVAFTHKVGGVLNFFKFYLMLLFYLFIYLL